MVQVESVVKVEGVGAEVMGGVKKVVWGREDEGVAEVSLVVEGARSPAAACVQK